MKNREQKQNGSFRFGEQSNARKKRAIAWLLLPGGAVGLVVSLIFDYILPLWLLVTLSVFFSLILAGSLSSLIFVFNKKYYNTFSYLLVLVIIGFLFMRNKWPGAGTILSISMILSAIGFFLMAMVSMFSLKKNRFLQLFGFFINLILMVTFFGGLFKIQHWPGAALFITVGLLCFFICVFSLVFTLPGANYIEWTEFHKKFFYRSILIPMIFIFITSALIFAFPKTWEKLVIGNERQNTWGMNNIELFDKDGIEK